MAHQNRSQIPGEFSHATAGIVREVAKTWSETVDTWSGSVDIDKREEALDQAASRIWNEAHPHLRFYPGTNPPESLMDRIKTALTDMGRAWDAVDGSAGAEYHVPHPNGFFELDTDDEAMKDRFYRIGRNATVAILMEVAEHEDLRAWTNIMWSHHGWGGPRKEDYLRPESAPHHEFVGFDASDSEGKPGAVARVAARVSAFFTGIRGIRFGQGQVPATA